MLDRPNPNLDPNRLLTPADIARASRARAALVGPPDPVAVYFAKLLRQAPELQRTAAGLTVNGIPRHIRSDAATVARPPPPRRWHAVAVMFDIATNILSPDPIEHMSPWGQSREVFRRVCLVCAKVAETPHPALFDHMLTEAPDRLIYFNIAAEYFDEYVTFHIYASLADVTREALLDAVEARYPDDPFPVRHLDPCGLRPGWPCRPQPLHDQEDDSNADADAPLRSLWYWR
jgi:hypothetical protein